jgi:hypothetical protein
MGPTYTLLQLPLLLVRGLELPLQLRQLVFHGLHAHDQVE